MLTMARGQGLAEWGPWESTLSKFVPEARIQTERQRTQNARITKLTQFSKHRPQIKHSITHTRDTSTLLAGRTPDPPSENCEHDGRLGSGAQRSTTKHRLKCDVAASTARGENQGPAPL